jgi:glucan phosphoethanolaminetransferase (alkaline phosphatase superfamily)
MEAGGIISINMKDNLIGLLLILGVFLSYHLLQPMGDGFFALETSAYSLKKHGVDNKHAKFKAKSHGIFYVRAGVEDDVRGILYFKQSGVLKLEFEIYDGAEARVELKHNDNVIASFLLRAKRQKLLQLDIQDDDEIEITAEHSEDGDAGKIKVIAEFQSGWFAIQNQLIPFLWALLFIFLWGKRHTFIAANTYFIFLLMLLAQKANFAAVPFQEVLAYMLFSFALAFTSVLVQQELSWFRKYKVATAINTLLAISVYVIPMSFILYGLNFDAKVTKDILFAVFQSNGQESLEYLSDFVQLQYIGIFVLLAVVMGFLLHQQELRETHRIEKSLLFFLALTFFSASMVQVSELTLPHFISKSFEKYKHELHLFRHVQDKRKAGDIRFSASKQGKGETFVVVIGESLNKKNMGLYDYVRDTTPVLSAMAEKKSLLVFQQAYANYSYTIKALQLSLTEANQYNGKDYYDSLSMVDVLKQAGVEVHWLTNQVIYGGWDNMISVIASEADHLVALNHTIGKHTSTQQLDGALVDELKKVLAQSTEKNRVIFVHLMGNHGSYALRYPKDFAKFKGPLDRGLFGGLADKSQHRQDKINAYDNSILYNDFVVSSLIHALQQQEGVTGLLYMPDHADDALAGKGHSSSKFNFHMLQIPMVAWFSDTYKAAYPSTYEAFKSHQNTIFSNDLLYDTVLGLNHIETDRYEAQHDLASPSYALTVEQALALHGKYKFRDKRNTIWWQKHNLAYLESIGQAERILPHQVSSIGKLKEVWDDGGRAFAMDIFFDAQSKQLRVGSQADALGDTLADFFKAVHPSAIRQVWAKLHHLSAQNINDTLRDLEALDKQFHFKQRMILESDSASPIFKQIADHGWKTSAALPAKKITSLLEAGDTQALKKLGKALKAQLQAQAVSGISFDAKVYDFVKQFLAPLLRKPLAYDVWYAPALKSPDFEQALAKDKLLQDKHVRLMLTQYVSEYD